MVYPLKIRKNTKLIQVWHAIGAFKRVGYSRVGKDGGPQVASLTHKNYTQAIVSSENMIPHYAEAFGIDKQKVIATGVPRTDLFYDEAHIKSSKEKIYQTYPNFVDKKVVLFAPTFRGNGKNSAHYPNEFLDIEYLYKALDSNTVFLVKLHPFIKNKFSILEKYQDKVIDVTDYPDINELLLISDILITDYSSCIFEFALLNKPTIFYVPDLQDYQKARDFYYDFDTYMYGQVAYNQRELVKNIKEPKYDKNKLASFKKEFLNQCDGKATQRFIDKIILERN